MTTGAANYRSSVRVGVASLQAFESMTIFKERKVLAFGHGMETGIALQQHPVFLSMEDIGMGISPMENSLPHSLE